MLTGSTSAETPAIHLYTRRAHRPILHLHAGDGSVRRLPFILTGKPRISGEYCWTAYPTELDAGPLRFRIELGNGTYTAPYGKGSFDHFETTLRTLWIQSGQIFSYRPAPNLSRSVVEKIDAFSGSLARRPLYIYLPRGYSQHDQSRYPVVFMQDGQNVFERYVSDSYSGAWRADQVADALINAGQMRECIIVGVGHGNDQRLAEYLPPDVQFTPQSKEDEADFRPIIGRANATAAYYQNDILPFIEQNYRTLPGRENRAVCGSSMGALFALYMGWAMPDFARNIAALSTSFWITAPDDGEFAQSAWLARLANERPDVRLWLDSGTNSADSDDGMADTLLARDTLLSNGWTVGPDFQYFLAEGGTHSEHAWSARLDQVLRFLLPF